MPQPCAPSVEPPCPPSSSSRRWPPSSCTGDEPAAPSDTAGVTASGAAPVASDVGDVAFVPGEFAYDFNGIKASLTMDGSTGTLDVKNGSPGPARQARHVRDRRRREAVRGRGSLGDDDRRRRRRDLRGHVPRPGQRRTRSGWRSCCSAAATSARWPPYRALGPALGPARRLALAGLPTREHEEQVAQPVQVAPDLGIHLALRVLQRDHARVRRAGRCRGRCRSRRSRGSRPGTMNTSGSGRCATRSSIRRSSRSIIALVTRETLGRELAPAPSGSWRGRHPPRTARAAG